MYIGEIVCCLDHQDLSRSPSESRKGEQIFRIILIVMVKLFVILTTRTCLEVLRNLGKVDKSLE